MKNSEINAAVCIERGLGKFPQLRSRKKMFLMNFSEKNFDFRRKHEKHFSRQGRRLCPINEAERNGLFCMYR